MKKYTSTCATLVGIGMLASTSAQAAIVIAAWGDFDSNTAPNASLTAANVVGTAATSSSAGSWSIDEGSGRGESNDATWGSFDGNGNPPPTTAGVGTAIKLNNGISSGNLDFTITNNGTVAIDLESFHFDSYAFRANAARSYQIEVLSGDLTAGVVFTSTALVIPANGSVDPAAHVDYDHSLTGLADHTLAAGESAVIRLAFSGGTGSGGGHHLFVDNIAVSGDLVPEPSSALLGLLGTGFFFLRRRR